MDISERILIRREALRMTQEDLAEKIGKNQQDIYRYESGKFKPNLSSLIALAEALEVSLDWLVGLNEHSELSEDEKQLLKLYRSKDSNRKGAILELVRIAQ